MRAVSNDTLIVNLPGFTEWLRSGGHVGSSRICFLASNSLIPSASRIGA